jgi:hypothetical protein
MGLPFRVDQKTGSRPRFTRLEDFDDSEAIDLARFLRLHYEQKSISRNSFGSFFFKGIKQQARF